MMKFYATILAYLQSDYEDTHMLQEILAFAKKAHPSWEASAETITFLDKCVNYGSSVKDEEQWSATLNDFAKAAFRDLSVVKNPEAMELFGKVASAVSATYSNGEDTILWARTLKERPDGSGVVVLHVSDLKRFRHLIENHDFVDNSTNEGTLEDGVLIGS